MEVGYKAKTPRGISFEVLKKVSNEYYIVKLWKDTMESHKMVSIEDIIEKKISFSEDFYDRRK